MAELGFLALGLLIGASIAWAWASLRSKDALAQEREGRVRAETQLEQAQRGMEEQKVV